MSTPIERVRRAVASELWALMPEKIEEITEFLALRQEGQLSAEEVQARVGSSKRPLKMVSGSVAVLPLFGVVSQRMDMMQEMSGGTSTEKFGRDFDRLMNDPEVGAIVINVDSPGGSVPGVMELANKIYEARGKGKQIIAVANSLAASAAYWIASAVDTFVVTPSGQVGSIGVYTVHADYSKALAIEGIDITITKAGKFKAEGNPYEPLTDETKASIQLRIDEIYNDFVTAVARNRGVTIAKVESGFGGGRVLGAVRAHAAGMVDRIATLEQVLAELGVTRSSSADARAEDEAPQVTAQATGAEDAMAHAIAEVAGNMERIQAVNLATEIIPLAADGAVAASEIFPPAQSTAPQAEENVMSDKNTDTAAAQNGGAGASTISVGADREAERQRTRTIVDLCNMHGISNEAPGFIASGASVDEVVTKLTTRAQNNLRAMTAPVVDMNAKDRKRYSITRAIMGHVQRDNGEAVTRDDGFEREVSSEIAKNLPSDYKSRGGIFIPTRHTHQAALDSETSTAGEELVFTRAGDFIDMLRARMVLAQMGATILTGLQGPVAFPKQSGAGTFTWVEENPASGVTDSDLTLTQVALTPKAGQSSTAYSRQLLAQGVIDVDNLVQNDLALITALGIDRAGIAGNTGGFNPVGVLYTSGIGDVAGGNNGAVPTYDHVVDLETEIANDNADIGSMAYLTTPAIRGKLKKTAQLGSTNGLAVWTGGMKGEINGYPGYVSTQVPSNLTKGTASGICHAILFGVWSQLIIGYWGAYELVIDPYTLKKKGLIELTSFQMAGLAVRHAESFAAMKDAKKA